MPAARVVSNSHTVDFPVDLAIKLGIDIGESSVTKYMVRCRKPPSQTWRAFLENHAKQLVSVDFFTVPTIRFQILYVRDALRLDPSDPDAYLLLVGHSTNPERSYRLLLHTRNPLS